jgi:hypothetical protein
MMTWIGRCGLALVILAALSGCAGQPRPAAPVAQPVAVSAATPAAAAASATAATGTAATEFKPPSNWHARVKDGKTMYCRKDTSVGSSIATQTCLTQADLKERLWHEQRGIEEFGRMRSSMPAACAPGSVCN